MSAQGPAFVTPHAVRQFQARIAPGLSYDQARAAILDSLQNYSNVQPMMSGVAFRVLVRRPYAFRAVVRPAADGKGSLPVVVTILRSGK